LTIEGDKVWVALPCHLLVSQNGASMVLDFHADPGSVARVRQRARELELYLNENHGDEQATQMPQGRPDPESFPVRQILAARPIAEVNDLPDGARLTLSPDRPDRAARLQAEVLWHLGDLLPGLPLAGKTCPELPGQLANAAAR
jgi:hypothetical protein